MYFAEGTLLAFVIAPEATVEKDLLTCRKLDRNGEKKCLLLREAIHRAVSLLQAVAFIRGYYMAGVNIRISHCLFWCHITVCQCVDSLCST